MSSTPLGDDESNLSIGSTPTSKPFRIRLFSDEFCPYSEMMSPICQWVAPLLQNLTGFAAPLMGPPLLGDRRPNPMMGSPPLGVQSLPAL